MANNNETGITAQASMRRVFGLTLGLACSVPLTATAAMANGPAIPAGHSGWQSHVGAGSFVHSNIQTFAAVTPTASSGSHAAANAVPFNHNLQHASASALQAAALAQQNGAGAGALNLASSRQTFAAGNIANFQTLTIDVGGHQQTVSLNSKLTAGELVAAEQVLSGAGQTIKLNAAGVATGGTVALNSTLLNALDHSVGGAVSSLTIARGVQVVDSLNLLTLSGNLNNYGSLVTAAGAAGASDTINANNIYNGRGGEIGSYTGGGGLYAADPILNAVTSFTNSGTISSAGNLTITAPVVYNVGSHGADATITAQQNVNIKTQTLDNAGVIAALTGNVNVAGNAGLNVIGGGGTMQATQGNVNLSTTDADLYVDGGNVQSQALNLSSGKGSIVAQFEQVTGVLNASGCNIHAGADTDSLQLGAINATDDPTFTSTGDLVFGSTLISSPGVALTLIAGKNIISGSGNNGLDTAAVGGPGGNITLIAGAAFTPFSSSLPPTTTGPVTVTKASSTGGTIDLTGGGANAVASINSSSAVGKGGNIQMIAFAGSVAGSGQVKVPGAVTINAAGLGGNGDVTILAGAKSGVAVSTGGIVGGNVVVDAVAPTIVSDKGVTGVVFSNTGDQVNGHFAPSKTGNVASISLGNVNASGASGLSILTGGGAAVSNSTSDLNLGTITVGAKTGSFTAVNSGVGGNGDININGVITGGTATLTTSGTGALTSAGSGSVNTVSASLNSASGVLPSVVSTNVTNLSFTAATSFTVNQGLNAVNVSGASTGGTFTLNSSGQINVTGLLKSPGVVLSTLTGTKGGIKIGAPISASAITLSNLGKGAITETVGTVVTGTNVTVLSDTNVGSKTAPLFTNASTLTVDGSGAKVVLYVSDLQPGTLDVQSLAKTNNGSLFLTSAATTLNLDSLKFDTVSVTDATVGATVGLTGNPATVYGGTGTFTLTAGSGSITSVKNVSISGSTVSLTGANGIGTIGNNVVVNSPILTANSVAGSVFVTDTVAATISGSAAAANTFTATDTATSATALTVGKSINGGNISLTTTNATSGINVAGTVGTANSNKVAINSAGAITTKGAISGSAITLTAAGLLNVGGAVGTSATSSVALTATGGTNGVTVGGVVTGNTITVVAPGTVTTTKAINATGALSTVTLTGGGAGAGNALVVGGAITGEDIVFNLNGGSTQGMLVNANVGTTAATASVLVDDSKGSGISGKGVISGLSVELDSAGAIGSAKTNVQTAATNLSINTGGANTGGVFISQKGNLNLVNKVQTDNLVMKISGNLDVLGTVNAANYALTSTGSTTIDGTVDSLVATGLTNTFTSTAFTINKGAVVQGVEPVVIKASGAGVVNGLLSVTPSMTFTAGSTFTVNSTGKIDGGADTINAKGAVSVDGQVGNASDKLVLTSGGLLTVGQYSLSGVIKSGTGANAGTVTAVTMNNFGTIDGDITLNATGSGNAINNYSVIGSGAANLVLNASKGAITSAPAAVVNGATVKLVAGSTATVNSNSTTNFNSASVKGALTITGTGGDLTVGSAAVGGFSAGSLNVNYTTVNTNKVTVNNIATTTGDLTVASSARDLIVGNSANLTTLAGNITLQNNNNGGSENINIGSSVVIHGSGAKTNLNQGNVYIVLGPVPTNPVPGPLPVPPGNVQGYGTTVFFGTNGITSDPTAKYNGLARNLIFNTGALPATQISVGANTVITADPPEGVVTLSAASAPALFATPAVAQVSMTAPTVVAASSQLPANTTLVSGLSALNNVSVSNAFAGGAAISDAGLASLASSNTGMYAASLTGSGGARTLSGGVSNSAERSIERGVSLLAPEQNTVVNTPFGSVSVAAGSVALVVSSDNGLSVYNLHDDRKDAVVINDGATRVALKPGRSAFITRSQNASFEELNPAQFVAYRQLVSRSLNGSGKLHQADFEIMSLVRGLPGVKELLSSDSARTRKTMANMLKTAAILMQLSQAGEAYSYKVAPALTAFAGSPR
ncbi:MAG: S-layer family protein [Cyanobacteria bacterium SZAS LIN-3]|nr:S-layer family protein [Cyanobacteria bacterium SZAS LIN-3]